MIGLRRWVARRSRTDAPEDFMRLSHRLVALHVGGIALLIGIVILTALWISARHNQLALESSHKLVRNEISGLRAGAFTLVRDYSLWDQAYSAVMMDDRDWLYSSIGSSVVELDTFDLDLIYIPSNGAQFGWIETSPPQGQTDLLPQDLLEEIFALLDSPGAASAESRTLIAEFDGSPWIFAVARLTPVDGAPENIAPEDLPRQVHGYRLTHEVLSRIGSDPLAQNLSLSPTAREGAASIPIMDFSGRTISYAVWDAPRPGASILRKAAVPLAIALGIATAISAISSLYAVRSARRLERALAAAKAADRSRMEFLSNVSHELRTPMNGVLGAMQLLETTDLDAEQREFVGLLRSSASAQMSLITDLIDLSRIDSGNRRVDTAPFEPLGVLKEVTDMMRVTAVKKGVRLEMDWRAPQDMTFIGDGQAFRQVLTNLVGNAVKFTDHGSVSVEAAAVRELDRIKVTVSVADTGPGIPEAALPRVFERFYQVDGSMSRLAEGTGLGLAISQKLVQALSGEIGVTSVYGEGSTFTFTANFDYRPRAAEARNAA